MPSLPWAVSITPWRICVRASSAPGPDQAAPRSMPRRYTLRRYCGVSVPMRKGVEEAITPPLEPRARRREGTPKRTCVSIGRGWGGFQAVELAFETAERLLGLAQLFGQHRRGAFGLLGLAPLHLILRRDDAELRRDRGQLLTGTARGGAILEQPVGDEVRVLRAHLLLHRGALGRAEADEGEDKHTSSDEATMRHN